ncbi:MAG: arylamine N-acetyltransferase [Chloroflexota bacterium]
MNIQTYLQRLYAHSDGTAPDLQTRPTPSYALLAELQMRHMLTIPFENLSVVWQEPIVLDEVLLYEKVIASQDLVGKEVGKQRGGFCYELNGLFSWLLRQFGFRVDRVAARVYNAETKTYGHPFDHLTLIVHLPTAQPSEPASASDQPIQQNEGYLYERYLVDVGFGDSVRSPLKLPERTPEKTYTSGPCGPKVQDVSGCYRLRAENDGQAVPETLIYERYMPEKSLWQPQFLLTTEPRELSDYEEGCYYHQTSPDSTFTQRTVCTKATLDGRITLSATHLTTTHFTTTRGNEKKRIEITSPDEFAELLKRHFDIEHCAINA